jgi:RimJ/RimL family protein N-acetyltransferase
MELFNFQTKTTIETERLILRPMEVSDSPDVVEWRNSDRIRSTLQNQNQEQVRVTIKDQKNWLIKTRGKRLDYIAIEKASGQKIGVWSFKPFLPDVYDAHLEQGRYIGKSDALGRGYAKELAKPWLNFGFDIVGAEVIVGVHRRDNILPQEINLKMGFSYFDASGLDSDLVAMKIER